MNYYNYFTEIEEHFVLRRGKHMYVSPLDWSLIAAWRDTGVPLHVALRGIDIAMDGFQSRKRRGHSRVNTLFYCHTSVMEEHSRYLEARHGEAAPETTAAGEGERPEKGEDRRSGPDRSVILEFLSARIAEIKVVLAKQFSRQETVEALQRVLGRLVEILGELEGGAAPAMESLERDLGILDELQVSLLRESVPAEQIAQWKKEATKKLKVYRKRLPAETYQRILENYLKSRVRELFGVGELSLFHL